MNKVDLKDFIRNFVNTIPKNRGKDEPIICLEFRQRDTEEFYSRIAIYRVESLRILWYKFTNSERDRNRLRDWPVTEQEWKVINILPPTLSRKISPDDPSSLAIIQVESFYD